MLIVLNGDNVETKIGNSIARLLMQLDLSPERVAVEVNHDIVPKAKYETHVLLNGDKVEIIHFVGGG